MYHTCACSYRGQKAVTRSPELDLQMVVDHPMWVLGNDPSSLREHQVFTSKPSLKKLLLNTQYFTEYQHMYTIFVIYCTFTWLLHSPESTQERHARRMQTWNHSSFLLHCRALGMLCTPGAICPQSYINLQESTSAIISATRCLTLFGLHFCGLETHLSTNNYN